MKKQKITGPTILTAARIIAVLPMVIFYMIEEPWAKWATLIIFVVAALTDYVDGKWARGTHQVTDLGKILDPIADKVLVYGAIACFCSTWSPMVIVLAIICIRDFVVDAMRIDVARKGRVIAASLWGKCKTATQMISIVLILLRGVLLFTPYAWAARCSTGVFGLGVIVLVLSLIFCLTSGYLYIRDAGYDYLGPWLQKWFLAFKRKKGDPQ